MTRPRTVPVAVLLLLVGTGGLDAQPRGIELFQLMGREQFARTTGTTRLQWLTAGSGYLESANDTVRGGRAFFRVDPAGVRRSPLFDDAVVSRIAAEYQRVTGRESKGLPFSQFNYEWEGRALSFSMQGEQFLYDLGRGELRKLQLPRNTGPLDAATGSPGSFSPDFNHYVFIRDYDNLFLFDTRTGQEERLTTGTSEDNLVGFLGAGPWFVWSPDSRHIAYLKASLEGISSYPILRSLERNATVENFRYPFTADPNPQLELWMVDLASRRHVKLAQSTVEQPYIRDIEWLPRDNVVVYQIIDQWESRRELHAATAGSGQTRLVMVDADSNYLNPLHNFRMLKDGKRFLWSSERTGWRHLYLFDLQGNLIKQLTSGDWDTNEVVRVDETAGWVYFIGFTNLGLDRHFYRVRLDGTRLTRLTPEPGFHVISMDPSARFFTDDFQSLTTPRTVTLRTADGKGVRQLAATNVDRVQQLGLPVPELLLLKAADGTTDLTGLLFRPAGFDSTRKYPVILSVYGGPHSRQVRNTYETTDFRARLAQLGFLVVEVDARGTPDRGKQFQTGNYLRLGQVDVDDQAAAIRQLAARSYVDGSRVGVTGLSHGGYMTLMLMFRHPDVFQVGAAGAPLTDVRLGPRQYIGRVMRTPQANPEGYAKADAISHIGGYQGRLMIYHGTNDRNALLGNTFQLVKKLVDAGKPVDMMIYPDGVHVLTGRDALHQVKTTVGYFLEHLKPENWEQSLKGVWN
jgi:dipeptidyl-peptidase-4